MRCLLATLTAGATVVVRAQDGAVEPGMHARRFERPADEPGEFGQLCDPRAANPCQPGYLCEPAALYFPGADPGRDARTRPELWAPVPGPGAGSLQLGADTDAAMAFFAGMRDGKDGGAFAPEGVRRIVGSHLVEAPHVCLVAPGGTCMLDSLGGLEASTDEQHNFGFIRADGLHQETCAGRHVCSFEYRDAREPGGPMRRLSKVRRCALPVGASCVPCSGSECVCGGEQGPCATYAGDAVEYLKQDWFEPPTMMSCASGVCAHGDAPGFQCGAFSLTGPDSLHTHATTFEEFRQ